jgi:hypothetical protein
MSSPRARVGLFYAGLLTAVLVLAVDACSGGGVATGPAPQPESGNQPQATGNASISLATIGVSVALPSVGGYAETITLPANDNHSATLNLVVSTAAPNSMPTIPESLNATQPYVFLKLGTTQDVTINGLPGFSVTIPSGALGTSPVKLGFYDPAKGWHFVGDMIRSGNTWSFSGTSTAITLKASTPYFVVPYSCTGPSPSPVASPSPSPVASPSPSPVASPSPSPRPSPSHSAVPSPSPSPVASPSPSPIASPSPKASPSPSPSPKASPSPSPHPSPSPSPVASPSPSPHPSPSPSPVASPSPSPHPSPSPSHKPSPSPSPVKSPSPSPSPTGSVGTTACLPQTVPGRYTSIVMQGNVNSSVTSFTGDPTTSIWDQADYSVAPPPPSPSPTPSTSPTPSPSPSPTSTPVPIFLFTGVFHVTSTTAVTDGCFTMITTQDGSPLPKSTESALGTGSPQFNVLTMSKNFTFGAILISNITLTKTGGSGTFTLSNGDSGTVTLTKRISTSLSKVRRPAMIRRH